MLVGLLGCSVADVKERGLLVEEGSEGRRNIGESIRRSFSCGPGGRRSGESCGRSFGCGSRGRRIRENAEVVQSLPP